MLPFRIGISKFTAALYAYGERNILAVIAQ